ncbi:MAG: tRNA (adenosine(37)-N6)-threonylcarbamoyltransferase complex dimerization subunit type 1 TsaB [Bacilli bacterium]|nr:tRNA (adenosine(37)-N6)-threonylcarbamoyltransferase complex dimerization subunit type 1 TsaB [Bacilli bacterium]
MRCLYIDTSSSFLYSALVEDDKVLSELKEEYGQNLSEVALPRIVSMFEKNNLRPIDIDKIIVVNGPGSFTGIRIGLTIAKVYAWSLDIPITTVLSLEAMAVSSSKELLHVPIINARRGYVFTAIYDPSCSVILKPCHIKMEELREKLKGLGEYEFISNDEFEDIDNINSYEPDFFKIVHKYKDRKSINPHIVNPEYLKLTEAEENKK